MRGAAPVPDLGAGLPREYRITAGLNRDGRRVYVVDAHRDDGHRYVLSAETMLTAFAELQGMADAAEVDG